MCADVNWDDYDISGCDDPDIYVEFETSNAHVTVEDADIYVGEPIVVTVIMVRMASIGIHASIVRRPVPGAMCFRGSTAPPSGPRPWPG